MTQAISTLISPSAAQSGNANSKLPIRVVIADDHPLIVMGTAMALSDPARFVVTGKAHNPNELMALLGSVPCDVVVCDLAMPEKDRGDGGHGDGLPMIGYLVRHFPHLHLIVQTMLDNPGILKGLRQYGVRGVLNKGDDTGLIATAITQVVKGGIYLGPSISQAFENVGFSEQDGAPVLLSKRETEVLRRYVGGETVKEIAVGLNRSVKTVSTQKMCAMQKLGVSRDADLFKYAQMNGLLNLPAMGAAETPSGE